MNPLAIAAVVIGVWIGLSLVAGWLASRFFRATAGRG